MSVWREEIKKMSNLSVLEYHGPNRHRTSTFPLILLLSFSYMENINTDLNAYDVVVTTYATLGSEYGKKYEYVNPKMARSWTCAYAYYRGSEEVASKYAHLGKNAAFNLVWQRIVLGL